MFMWGEKDTVCDDGLDMRERMTERLRFMQLDWLSSHLPNGRLLEERNHELGPRIRTKLDDFSRNSKEEGRRR